VQYVTLDRTIDKYDVSLFRKFAPGLDPVLGIQGDNTNTLVFCAGNFKGDTFVQVMPPA
jgi:hypothetical protein